jgi:hypothetical protein
VFRFLLLRRRRRVCVRERERERGFGLSACVYFLRAALTFFQRQFCTASVCAEYFISPLDSFRETVFLVAERLAESAAGTVVRLYCAVHRRIPKFSQLKTNTWHSCGDREEFLGPARKMKNCRCFGYDLTSLLRHNAKLDLVLEKYMGRLQFVNQLCVLFECLQITKYESQLKSIIIF